jgi:uncharacterized SAM-binding protein YcdF (DUF218 family)
VKIFSNTGAGPGRWLKIVLIAVLLLLLWSALAWWLAERLIVQRPFEKADAIVVLGGSATYIERTRKAAELFKAGVSDRLILTNDGLQSGWSQPDRQNLYFIERARRELVAQGVPPENIEELPQIVSGTKDEALLVGQEAPKRGWRRVLIVTSAYHSRRALWLFELQANKGDTEFGLVSPPPGEQTPLPFNWWLSPKGWNMVAGEYLKSAYYMMFD